MRNKYVGIAVLALFALGALALSPISRLVSWRLERKLRKAQEEDSR